MELLIFELVGMGIMLLVNIIVVRYQNHIFFKSLDKRLEKLEKHEKGAREGEDESFFHKA